MAASFEDMEVWATLGRAFGLHAGPLRLLDDPRVLIGMSRRNLAALRVPELAASWLSAPRADVVAADLRWLARSGTQLVPFGAPRYPPLLAAIEDAPAVLYVRGRCEALVQPQVAVVGSRNPTAAGARTARELAGFLAAHALTVTSGLARGIDAASHEGALEAGGLTVAVFGTGLDTVYPRQHAELARRIEAQGALVSEFPPGTVPQPLNFPQRNRIISGLAVGTLVVEAASQSGSLITARRAGEQGRSVMAMPGSIHSPLARGCHHLLREGAVLVENGSHILEEIQKSIEHQLVANVAETRPSPDGAPPRLDKEYEMLLDALGFEPASIDMLVDRTGLAGESVAAMLLLLELTGRIEPRTGGTYSRIS